jgi:hypothetical protein
MSWWVWCGRLFLDNLAYPPSQRFWAEGFVQQLDPRLEHTMMRNGVIAVRRSVEDYLM